jgi:hypothetical protein
MCTVSNGNLFYREGHLTERDEREGPVQGTSSQVTEMSQGSDNKTKRRDVFTQRQNATFKNTLNFLEFFHSLAGTKQKLTL